MAENSMAWSGMAVYSNPVHVVGLPRTSFWDWFAIASITALGGQITHTVIVSAVADPFLSTVLHMAT